MRRFKTGSGEQKLPPQNVLLACRLFLAGNNAQETQKETGLLLDAYKNIDRRLVPGRELSP